MLPALAGAALLVGAGAHTASAQTTYYGGGSISASGPNANASSTLLVSGASGTVQSISVTLNGVTSDGNSNLSVFYSSFVLVAPSGQRLVLLGSTGDSFDSGGLSNATITIDDGASAAAPGGSSGSGWSVPSGGTADVKPSSYWIFNNGALPPDINGDFVPQTDGPETLTSTFAGANPNGTWTLYVLTDDPSALNDPIAVSNWSLTMTFNPASSDATSTTVSSNIANPASTSNSVTLKATVADATNPGITVTDGTVAFSANGSVISGCAAQLVASGTATCTTTFPTQGLYPIVASYTAGSGFASSTSGTIEQLVENPTTNPSTDTWCNTGSVTIPGVNYGLAYPSVIKVTGASGSVANAEVELFGVTGIVYAQHLLVAPDGTHNLDFFDSGFNPNDTASSPGINLNFYDLAGGYPDNNNAPASADYEASDLSSTTDTFPASSAHAYDSSIPQVPATINFGYDPNSTSAHGPITETFESNFSGASPNGTWALYPYTGLAYPETISGGWCLVLTLNSGVATTTTLNSNKNPQVAQTPVTLTATVKAGSNPVTDGGTVTFLQNGAMPSGVTSPNNVVNLSTSNGQASLTTGTVSSSIDIGNASGTEKYKTIYEGDYDMSADYSGVSGLDNLSTGNLWQRFNNTTTLTAGPGGSIQACNTGAVLLDQVNNLGAFQPNPSVITVANLPGTVSTVTVSLNGYYTSNAGSTYKTESLLEGPTGAALDFFSNTGDSSTQLGTTTSPLGTLTFADSGSGTVPSSGNYAAGTYQPTAYQGSSSTDTFTSSASGLYNVPGSFTYAQPHGSGTFTGTFGGTSPNGNWSLFFNSTAAVPAEGAQSGWCLNFSENPVAVTVNEGHNGSGTSGDFVQSETGAQITTTVINSGPGSTGDPLTTNPLTVVDTLNSALTYQSYTGTNWSCGASGQTVTCTNDSSIAAGNAYPTLTLNVNVSSSASGSIANSATVSGADIASNTGNDTITVENTASLTITKTHTGIFTQGSTGVWSLLISNTATTGGTNGTVNVSDTLPSGYTLSSFTSTSNLWTCSGTTTVTCTATPGIPSGGINTIDLTVNIPTNSPASVNNTAYVWGGGDPVHTSLATAASSTDSNVTVMQIPATVAVSSGSPQSTPVGTAFGTFLTVVVKDAASQPISGASVSFSGPATGASASFSLPSCTTGVNGECSVQATANTIAGAYSVTAQAGTASASFSLTNTVGPAAKFLLTGGNTQSAYVQTGFSVPLAAQVTDTYNNPISGLTVGFTAPASGAGATLSNAGSCTTGANGSCSVTAAANSSTGSYNVTAAVSGDSSLGTLSYALTNNPPPSYVVNTTADDATGTASNCPIGGAGTPACTLRDALAAAAATGTGNITFSSMFNTAQTITLANGTFTIPSNTTIAGATSGSGATLRNLVTVNGNNADTVFAVNSGATGAALSNLIITAGHGSEFESGSANLVGGGIYNAGSLTVTACTVSGSTAPTVGGGIYNTGTLHVVDSTVSGNSAQNGGGGGILNSGTATVVSSSFFGNSATAGAGIYSTATLTVVNSTVSGNSASSSGAGMFTNGGTLTLNNSIISGNSSTDAYGSASGSGNLVGDGTNFTLTGSNNQIGTSGAPIGATLSSLGYNGGPTHTMILLPGSAAICAGSYSAAQTAGLSADQRGVAFGNTGAGGYCAPGSIDAGAVQTDYALKFVQQPSTVVQKIAMTPAPTVEIDENGAPFADGTDTVSIPLALTTGSGTLAGSPVSTSATTGIATYSALSVSLPGTGDQLTASLALNPAIATNAPTITALSGNFNVDSAVTQLAFATAPASTVTAGGNAGASIVVDEEDVNGALVATAGDSIALTVTGPNSYAKTYTATAVSGVASFDLSAAQLTVGGAYSYTASIAATPAVTNATASETVNAASAATVSVVAGSSQSATIGAAFASPLTVKVVDQYNNPVPSATVVFTAPATGAAATFSVPAVTAADGTTSVTATANGLAGSYSVTAGISGATSAAFALANSQAATALAVAPTATTLLYGQPVTVNASITPASVLGSTPTGTVAFYDGATPLTPASTVAGAAASFAIAVPTVGSHTYAALYVGDANFKASTLTRAASALLVNKASSTLTGPSSTVTLTYGTGGAIKIAVDGQFSGAGIAKPTGTLTYAIGAGVPQTAAIASGAAALAVPTTLAAGNHIVTVSYAGDGNYNAAGDIRVNLTVSPVTLAIVANSASKIYGTANPAFTGTVTGQQNGDTFTESFSTGATLSSPVGSYPIVPSVTGTNLANYTQAITNGALTVTQAGSTTSLQATSNSITPGQSVTLTATVRSVTTGTPTGTVKFYDSGSLIGTATMAGGVAAYSTNALAPGIAHTITATYSGDINFTPSASTIHSSTPITVAPLDFTMNLTSPSNLSVIPGHSVSFQFRVTPMYGSYAGPVNFTMSGLPAGATATFSPSTIAANGGPQTVTVTIATLPATARLERTPPASRDRKAAPFALAFLLLFGAGTLRKRGEALRRLMCLLLLVGAGLLATGLSGCGSNGGFFAKAPRNYSVTLTATAANVEHSTTINLNVQ